MKFQPGDIVYDGGGNGIYCTLAKVKIVEIVGSSQNQYYRVELLEDIFHIWGKNPRGQEEQLMVGDIENAIEGTVFENYADAEENMFIVMGKPYGVDIRTWKDFLTFLFEKWEN